MDPRRSQEQIGLFPVPFQPNFADVERLRAEAIAARDAAVAQALKRSFTGIGKALAAIGAALTSWPERRATYENLRALTDRELADIGLTRGDISRVFEPEFKVPGRPANANGLPSGRPKAA